MCGASPVFSGGRQTDGGHRPKRPFTTPPEWSAPVMAKRPRDSKAQLDLFAMDPEPAKPDLPEPAPAQTTQLSKLAAQVVPSPPVVASVVDGDRKFRTTRRSASDIAERAAESWHRQHAGDGIAIPMGIVAGLTLLRKVGSDGTDVASLILDLDKPTLLEFHRRIWGHMWI